MNEREGILEGSICRDRGVQWESKVTYSVCDRSENQLSKGILSYYKGNYGLAGCGAELVELAGNLKGLVYYVVVN